MIEAAGGLVWRFEADGTSPLVALVHRSRYDDWTLPKGKLISGETPLAAAIREVREETGYEVEVLGFAGSDCLRNGERHEDRTFLEHGRHFRERRDC